MRSQSLITKYFFRIILFFVFIVLVFITLTGSWNKFLSPKPATITSNQDFQQSTPNCPIYSNPEPTPPSISLAHEINDSSYTLSNKDNRYSLILNQFRSGKNTELWKTTSPFDLSRLSDFWFDDKSNLLYTIEGLGTNIAGYPYEEISQYSFQNNVMNKKMINFYSPGLYGITKIIDFNPLNQNLLLSTIGGDGCGGGGKIWTSGQKVTTKIIQNFGFGCIIDYPNYIGYDGNYLYFADVDGDKVNVSEFFLFPYISVYRINPWSREKLYILSKTELQSYKFVKAEISKADKNYIIFSDLNQKNTKFHLTTRSFE